MTLKLYIKTHGCQMNEYDSAKMVDVLGLDRPVELTQRAEDADLLLLNTCSIREKAQEKVFSQLGEWRELKHARPGIMIGVGGCVASQEGAELLKRAPYVDVVFGPQTLHRLPALLEQTRHSRRPAVDVSFPEIEKFDALPAPHAEGPTAYVSIMEGCSKYCTFCVVPYTRGEEINRPFDDVLAEVGQLAAQGVREVTLLGQNVNAYRGPLHEGGYADLALAIEYIAALDGIGRIRYTTSHPIDLSERLIHAHGTIDKLVPQLHLPVQSGADRILAAMKRGHTVLEYKSKIRRLRAVRPDLSLSTDIIVGFPGESEEDFAATLRLVEEMNYDRAFSFIYSPRPGTPASTLAPALPDEIKRERLQRLQQLVNRLAAVHAHSRLNTVQQVLVERHNPDGTLSGCAPDRRAVHFHGPLTLIGQFVDVRITEVRFNSLCGRLEDVNHAAA